MRRRYFSPFTVYSFACFCRTLSLLFPVSFVLFTRFGFVHVFSLDSMGFFLLCCCCLHALACLSHRTALFFTSFLRYVTLLCFSSFTAKIELTFFSSSFLLWYRFFWFFSINTYFSSENYQVIALCTHYTAHTFIHPDIDIAQCTNDSKQDNIFYVHW